MDDRSAQPGAGNATKEYLWTLDELYKASVGDLGPMDAKGYQEFMEEAREVARESEISNPKIMIDVKRKDGLEQPYPIADFEWQACVDTIHLCHETTHVHVVDGDKYTAPI